MKCFINLSQIATLEGVHKKDGRKLDPDDLGIISNAAVVFNQNEILWVGSTNELPSEYVNIATEDLTGKTLVPEIVDSHTHLVFAGDRSQEYCERLNGVDYVEIAKRGGGILTTMNGTLNASREELFATAVQRIEKIKSYGVGTIEIKSGYALTYDKEYELSHIIHNLKNHFKGEVQILNTFMAAHAVPNSYKNSSSYLIEVVIPLMEKLADEQIIDAVDIFHEQGYFDSRDVEKLFKKARELGIDRKSHVDEFNDNNGASLAVKHEAISVEHLLMTSDKGIKDLANSNTVANLLPGTGFFLAKPQSAARKMLDSGVKVAIASDYNPGSCHWNNVIKIASMAAPQLKMNICELWAAITYNAAHALNLRDQGTITKGMKPRFSLFDTDTVYNITYNWGDNLSLG